MKDARVFSIRCQYQGRVYPASVRDDSRCQKLRTGHPREEINSNKKKKESGRDGPAKIRLSTTHTLYNKQGGRGVQVFQ